jgi:hypothetical protein
MNYVCCSNTMCLLFLNYVCVVPELCVCWSWTMCTSGPELCIFVELCVLSQNYVGCVSRNHVYVWIMVLLEICLCMDHDFAWIMFMYVKKLCGMCDAWCVSRNQPKVTSKMACITWFFLNSYRWEGSATTILDPTTNILGRRVRRRQYLILLLIF